MTQTKVTPQRDMMESRNLHMLCLPSSLCSLDRIGEAWVSALNWFGGKMCCHAQNTTLSFRELGTFLPLPLAHGWPWGKTHFRPKPCFSLTVKWGQWRQSLLWALWMKRCHKSYLCITISWDNGAPSSKMLWDLEVQNACIETTIIDMEIPNLFTLTPVDILSG